MAASKQKLTPAQKIIWTSTAGTVTSGSPASHGQALAARADGLAGSAQTGAISNSIPNLGCPEASVAQGEETPIIQGTATAPSGTTAPWSFRADATGYLASPNDGNNATRNVHIKAYIGTPDSSCVDFPSCKSQLAAVDATDVAVLAFGTFGSTPIQTPASITQAITNLGPSATVVFFETATPDGAISCASGTISRTANAIAQ